MNKIDELYYEYLYIDSYEKQILLLIKVLDFIKKEGITLSYSDEFIEELSSFSNTYLSLLNKNINLINLLINTTNRNYDLKADIIYNIKQTILSRFDNKDLNFLRINHIALQNIIKEKKELFEAYSEHKFVDNKILQEIIKDKSKITNYFILKKEYESMYNYYEKYQIFHKEYRPLIVKEEKYNKPVYIGLKHLLQNESYMEGPYFKNIKCPKCGSKIIHLLEGITKDGAIYTCDNLSCKFFINGNFFLKKGKEDLINYFNITKDIKERRNSSHHKIYLSLYNIQRKEQIIEILSDGFIFRYTYHIEAFTIGFKLIEIEYNNKILNLKSFYKNKYRILNFLNNFFEGYKFD